MAKICLNDKANCLQVSHTASLALKTLYGLNQSSFCFPSLQSARDIESRMRNETRLKLFTLDPDTQVI